MTAKTTMNRLPVSELLRLACIYAERDQEEFLASIKNTGDEELKQETASFLKQIREYRMRRWGETRLENLMKKAKSVPITEIRKRFEKATS